MRDDPFPLCPPPDYHPFAPYESACYLPTASFRLMRTWTCSTFRSRTAELEKRTAWPTAVTSSTSITRVLSTNTRVGGCSSDTSCYSLCRYVGCCCCCRYVGCCCCCYWFCCGDNIFVIHPQNVCRVDFHLGFTCSVLRTVDGWEVSSCTTVSISHHTRNRSSRLRTVTLSCSVSSGTCLPHSGSCASAFWSRRRRFLPTSSTSCSTEASLSNG